LTKDTLIEINNESFVFLVFILYIKVRLRIFSIINKKTD